MRSAKRNGPIPAKRLAHPVRPASPRADQRRPDGPRAAEHCLPCSAQRCLSKLRRALPRLPCRDQPRRAQTGTAPPASPSRALLSLDMPSPACLAGPCRAALSHDMPCTAPPRHAQPCLPCSALPRRAQPCLPRLASRQSAFVLRCFLPAPQFNERHAGKLNQFGDLDEFAVLP